MKKTGAWLVRQALEQIGVQYTFGIPGVQNTEIYDELNKSDQITPVLVTHEGGGAFMADAVSRTSESIGTLLIVPSAGVTHAMSGIGEAFLDGIPLLIVSGGIRRDIDKKYQLHELDQHELLKSVTKKTWLVTKHEDIVPFLFEAYVTAISGEPGPVFVEIPVDIQLFKGDVKEFPAIRDVNRPSDPDKSLMKEAVELLKESCKIGIFAGWGARDCTEELVRLAEKLGAPVSTTLQGLSVFPADHPLHTGMGFGASAVPAAENAFRGCDCMIAVGTRFAEIPTGSFGVEVPENLIHIDINPEVFSKNYPAKVAIEGDAAEVICELNKLLEKAEIERVADDVTMQIQADKKAYVSQWEAHATEKVNPARFFRSLKTHLKEDAIVVADDGNHTFLAAELFPVTKSKHFICPSDFNCMGYCVPAAIGTKLASPEKQVVGVVGDGAFIMTCMEILTASSLNLGVTFFVFHDGELSQISQGQEIPYNRKVCTVLGKIGFKGVADATGAAYLEIKKNDDVDQVIQNALLLSESGQPVIVDVAIDYSKRTKFTQGVVKTVLKRFPLGDKFRFIGRALIRKITG